MFDWVPLPVLLVVVLLLWCGIIHMGYLIYQDNKEHSKARLHTTRNLRNHLLDEDQGSA